MGGVPISVSQDIVIMMSSPGSTQTSWPMNIILVGGGVGTVDVGSSVGRLILGGTPVYH